LGGLPALFIVGGSLFSLYKIKIILVDQAAQTDMVEHQDGQFNTLSAGIAEQRN
jgi:hypothetical protein